MFRPGTNLAEQQRSQAELGELALRSGERRCQARARSCTAGAAPSGRAACRRNTRPSRCEGAQGRGQNGQEQTHPPLTGECAARHQQRRDRHGQTCLFAQHPHEHQQVAVLQNELEGIGQEDSSPAAPNKWMPLRQQSFAIAQEITSKQERKSFAPAFRPGLFAIRSHPELSRSPRRIAKGE